MLGLSDSTERAPSARNSARMGFALQQRTRPHSSLGPGIPDRRTVSPRRIHRHCFEPEERVVSTAILGGFIMNMACDKRPRRSRRDFCGAQVDPTASTFLFLF